MSIKIILQYFCLLFMPWCSFIEPTGGVSQSAGDGSPRWRGRVTPSDEPCDLWPQHGRRRPPPVTYEWDGTPCNAWERGRSEIRVRGRRRGEDLVGKCTNFKLHSLADQIGDECKDSHQHSGRGEHHLCCRVWRLGHYRGQTKNLNIPTNLLVKDNGLWTCVRYKTKYLCVTDQVHPGTCWWWRWWWSGPGSWSPPAWCWHSRCQAPEMFALDALHTQTMAARHRKWCHAPEYRWRLT